MARKKRSVTIRSMGDLVDLVNHNCDVFDRSIKKLSKKSRSLNILCFVAIGTAIRASIESMKHEEQIYQLSVRIKKLERGEGE